MISKKILDESIEVGFSDEFSFDNLPIRYEINGNKELKLYVKDCALAVGRVRKSTKNGIVYENIDWKRTFDDLINLGILDKNNIPTDVTENNKARSKYMECLLITESQLYKWALKLDTVPALKFQQWVCDTVLPNLRQHGIYITGMENMTELEMKVAIEERIERYWFRKFGKTFRRTLTDAIKDVIKPLPADYGFVYGGYTNLGYKIIFGKNANDLKQEKGLSKTSSKLRDSFTSDELNIISKLEDTMANFIMAGITDEVMLESMLANWHSSYKQMNI